MSGYQATRNALLRLDPLGTWKKRLKPLQKSEVRAPEQDESDVEQEEGIGAQSLASRICRRVRAESKRQISWIWKVPRETEGCDDVGDGTSVEEEIGSGERNA